MNRFKLDVHTHTVASGHAYSTLSENALYASQNGIELLGTTEHAPKMPGAAHPLYFLNARVVPRELYGIRLMMGVELNILDSTGKLDLKNNLLKRLDYAIASLHTVCIDQMDRDESTQALIEAMKNPYVNIIGHPCDPRYPLDIKAVVSAARDNNVLLELNNSSLNPNNSRAGGEAELLELVKECKRQAMPVILGSDAHFFTYIGGFDNVIRLLDEAQMPDELILNTSVKKFEEFIKLKRDKIEK